MFKPLLSLSNRGRFLQITATLAGLLTLTACSTGDAVAYRLSANSNDRVLSLARERNFIWENWTPYLIITNMPDCQRRFPLKGVSSDIVFKVELYQAPEGGYILRQGKRWYVAEASKCQFQQFKEPPPEPGTLVGLFTDKEGSLQFKPAETGSASVEGKDAAAQ